MLKCASAERALAALSCWSGRFGPAAERRSTERDDAGDDCSASRGGVGHVKK